jgi:hypothetical protein
VICVFGSHKKYDFPLRLLGRQNHLFREPTPGVGSQNSCSFSQIDGALSVYQVAITKKARLESGFFFAPAKGELSIWQVLDSKRSNKTAGQQIFPRISNPGALKV